MVSWHTSKNTKEKRQHLSSNSSIEFPLTFFQKDFQHCGWGLFSNPVSTRTPSKFSGCMSILARGSCSAVYPPMPQAILQVNLSLSPAQVPQHSWLWPQWPPALAVAKTCHQRKPWPSPCGNFAWQHHYLQVWPECGGPVRLHHSSLLQQHTAALHRHWFSPSKICWAAWLPKGRWAASHRQGQAHVSFFSLAYLLCFPWASCLHDHHLQAGLPSHLKLHGFPAITLKKKLVVWLSSHHTPRNKSFGYPANKKIPAYSYGYHSPIFSSHRSCPWKSTAGPYLIKFWLLLFLFLLSIFSRVRSRPLQTHGFLQLSAVFPWQPKVLQKIWVHSFFFQSH